ncbi:hypothetical protein CHS0354_001209, partial [Potamilus streckersoni]
MAIMRCVSHSHNVSQGDNTSEGITLNGGVESLGLALKSKDKMISTRRCGLNATGYGELNKSKATDDALDPTVSQVTGQLQ